LIFVLILAAHVARVISEGLSLLKEPMFVFTSVLSLGIAAWAFSLLRRARRNRAEDPAGPTSKIFRE
jgi:hypothetical protein